MTDAKAQLSKEAARGADYDFLIGCNVDSESGKLSVVAGAPGGDAAVFPLKVAGGTCKLRTASYLLSGGHTEVSYLSHQVSCCSSLCGVQFSFPPVSLSPLWK